VAVVTQDVALAGNVSVQVTFDDLTGIVSTVKVTNNGSVAGSFSFLALGIWTKVVIPVGVTSKSLALTVPALIRGSDLTWDWDFSQYGWSMDGT
jgi:hypothetical protein